MTSKRFFDIIVACIVLFLLAPMLAAISLWIAFDSKGGVFYQQKRSGKNNKPFFILKFRTMRTGADKSGLLTVGDRDPRVTNAGVWLRKYKLDELPQFWNVLRGEMSVVGPRPEVQRYTDLYTPEQARVLDVQPGITDLASIEYADESELLAQADDPENLYIHTIMPAKLALNAKYIATQSLATDFSILIKTFLKIIKK